MSGSIQGTPASLRDECGQVADNTLSQELTNAAENYRAQLKHVESVLSEMPDSVLSMRCSQFRKLLNRIF